MYDKKRILFVDDEPEHLNGLRRMLRGQQHLWDMYFVDNVDEAIDKLDSSPFDTVVTDVKMPVRNGFDLLSTIQESTQIKDTPVIVLTGIGDESLKRRALDLGATDLLDKPVHPLDLIARLRSALRLKQYHDELKEHNLLLEHKVEERTLELEKAHRDVILRLAIAGDIHEDGAGHHVVRVGNYCSVLAEALGMPQEFVKLFYLTSPLHDIGKIGIPERILLKAGPLSPEERTIMQQHCVFGAAILQRDTTGLDAFLVDRTESSSIMQQAAPDNPFLKMAASIAMTHHEHWDGQGYPTCLAGEEIPIEGRIIAIADVYDALRSKRSYKPPFSEDETISIMKREVGEHFDPNVYAAFEEISGEFQAIWDRFPDEN